MTTENITFPSLGLDEDLCRAVADAGYTQPTPIQRDAIPHVLKGKDLLGCAQTGTGKTAAFTLPLLQRIDATAGEEPSLRALVLTPTRELAAQIGASFKSYGRYFDLWHTVIFGGVKDRPQIAELREGVDALVATPGRLLDLMERRHVDLSKVEVFVLDEADRMLDMGFLPDVKRVIAKLPKKRQTLLFSATMPGEIRDLAQGMLIDPVQVAVARISAPAANITQRVYFVDRSDKRKLLVDVLDDPEIRCALVFSRTKHGANRLVRTLERADIAAAAIHGNKSQAARTRALQAFRNGEVRVLVATDIAARGIDVEGVTHVIQVDLPEVAETYVHRIGRTARAGASGIALSFCDVEERDSFIDIERLVGKHLDRVEDHGWPCSDREPPVTDLKGTGGKSGKPRRRGGGGGGGRRGGGGGGPRGGGGGGGGGRRGGGGGGGGGYGGRW